MASNRALRAHALTVVSFLRYAIMNCFAVVVVVVSIMRLHKLIMEAESLNNRKVNNMKSAHILLAKNYPAFDCAVKPIRLHLKRHQLLW